MDNFKSQIIHVVNTVDKLNIQERLEALSYLQKITEAYKNKSFSPDINLCSPTELGKNLNKNFKHKCKNQLCLTNNIKHLKKIVCFKCDKRLESEFQLFEHSHAHLDYPLSCIFCRCVFRNIEDYNSHKDCNQCSQKYVCKVCQNSFPTKKTLQSHLLDNHGMKLYNNWYGCKLCHEMFEQKKSLYLHYKENHSELKCQLNTGSSEGSQNNKYNEVPDVQDGLNEDLNEDKFQCLHCSKIFKKKSRLSVHMKRHFRKKKEFNCKLCKKNFTVYRNYQRHLKSASHQSKEGHTNHPLFKCEICEKLFASRDSLTRHQLRLHFTSDKRLKCPLCDFKTSLGTSLSRHINLHTDNRKFICDQCGSCFHTLSALKDHTIYIHSNERNYSCEMCGQRFKLKSGLNRHFRTHSNEKEFKCFCGQIYKFRTNLKRHLLVAHKIAGEKKNIARVTNEEEGYVMNSPRVVKKKSKRNAESKNSNKIDDFDITSLSALSDVDLSCTDEVLRETYNSLSKYSTENSESQESLNSILTPVQLIDHVLQTASQNSLKTEEIPSKIYQKVGESSQFVENNLPTMNSYKAVCRQYLNSNFNEVVNNDYASHVQLDNQFVSSSLESAQTIESFNRQYNSHYLTNIAVEDKGLNEIYNNR